MFVIQRVLESEGNFTLLDKNKVLEQHDFWEYLLLLTQLDLEYDWPLPWNPTNKSRTNG